MLLCSGIRVVFSAVVVERHALAIQKQVLSSAGHTNKRNATGCEIAHCSFVRETKQLLTFFL